MRWLFVVQPGGSIGQEALARYRVVASEAELLRLAVEFVYPVFLQPANVSASMWSTANLDDETLLRNNRSIS